MYIYDISVCMYIESDLSRKYKISYDLFVSILNYAVFWFFYIDLVIRLDIQYI
jgi:hypothetical protein